MGRGLLHAETGRAHAVMPKKHGTLVIPRNMKAIHIGCGDRMTDERRAPKPVRRRMPHVPESGMKGQVIRLIGRRKQS